MKSIQFCGGRSILGCVGLVMFIGLASCSKEGGREAYAAQEQAQQKAAAMQVPAAPKSAATAAVSSQEDAGLLSDVVPKFLTYGPQEVEAGKAFNPQPDGSSALWIKLDQSMENTDAVISLDGHPLATSISGDVVTAVVPLEFIGHPGTLKLEVARTGSKGQILRTDTSPFIVR